MANADIAPAPMPLQRSSIVDLLSILREIFAKEPPVKYKQQQMRAPPQPQQTQNPPPLPLPPELSSRSNQTPPPPPPQPAPQMPPQPPPKPGKVQESEQQQPPAQGRYQSPPPPPPLPPKSPDPRRESLQYQNELNGSLGQRVLQYMPQRSSSLRNATTSQPAQQPQPPALPPKPPYQQRPFYSPEETTGPGIPMLQTTEPTISNLQSVAYGNQQQQPSQYPLGQYLQGRQQPHPSYQPQPFLQQPPAEQQQQQQQQQQYLPPQQPVPFTQPAPAPAPKTETPDLLTSPFELELPAVTPSGPAPPIPPNPEKDALLRAVSKALTETLQNNVAKSKSAVQPLLYQASALHAAITNLQNEIAALNNLNATLQSNTAILQQSLHRADAVIADAQARISTPPPAGEAAADGRASGLPPIDEVLVAPTVVGKQLYDLVADERGIQRAIYALQAALVKGVIGVETWSRHTRGLAREAFLKRALIRKIGKGMGLEGS